MSKSNNKFKFLYFYIILPVLMGGFHVLSPFFKKIKSGLNGRVGLEERVKAFRESIGDKKIILFHCASAGEFEALRPLAKEFDRNKFALAVSYFSPSAKKAAENSSEFDFTDYSPFDTKKRTLSYYKTLKPSLIAITKHDVWPGFVWSADDLNLPIILINGNFHKNSLKNFPLLKEFHQSFYKCFNEIMVVSDEDKLQASKILGSDYSNIVNVGDTRYDQTLARARLLRDFPQNLTAAIQGKIVFVVGSSHFDDENLIIPVLSNLSNQFKNLVTIVVPHDPSVKAKLRIQDFCGQYQLKLQDIDNCDASAEVILVNKTGLLADLYSLGDFAYVGGGFGKGVHSVLEPFAHSLPVICGTNISVSNEARDAQKLGLVNVVNNRDQILNLIKLWLNDNNLRKSLSKSSEEFVKSRSGATSVVAKRVNSILNA